MKRGLLAEGTVRQIRDRITQLLVAHGLAQPQAGAVVDDALRHSAGAPLTERSLRQLHDVQALFGELRRRGIKVGGGLIRHLDLLTKINEA